MMPNDIKIYSPLQGNSGFCGSWSLYTTLVFMLNTDKTLEEIGEYLANYNLKLVLPKKIEDYKKELDECHKPKPSPEPSKIKCKKKEDIIKEFNKYIKYDGNQYYVPLEENILQKNPKYILTKHIKLYRMIIYMLYIITRKFNELTIFDNINDLNDKNILNEIFDKFYTYNKDNDIIKNRLILKSKNEFKFDITNITNKDTHLCDDNLFNHTDFCKNEDVTKPIPNPDNWNCKNNKLKEDKNIRLRGLISSKKEESDKNSILNNNINYIFKNYIY